MIKNDIQRLNNLIGQLEGVKKMMEQKSDCAQVLTQLKAIKSGVGKVMDNLVEAQFEKCMSSVKETDKELLLKIKKYV